MKDSMQNWRSLSELRAQAAINDFIEREFPVAASEFPEGVSRRRWMQLMGASIALAGAAGCRYPEESIVPFVIRPEGRVPGEMYKRATNFELAGRVYNLLVSCVDGRPLKIEPNREHPSGNGTDAFSQASILGLYDPDRMHGSQGFLLRKDTKRRVAANWEEFRDYAKAIIQAAEDGNQGSRFALLMSPTLSPSIVRMVQSLVNRLPNLSLCIHDGVEGDAMRQATAAVFGKPCRETLALDQADVIVSIQCDFLGTHQGMIAAASSFSRRRDPSESQMNRLYVVEGGYTLTGASADSRLALRPSQMPAFLGELTRRIQQYQTHSIDHVLATPHATREAAFDTLSRESRTERFLDVLASDIAAAGDQAVIVVGNHLGADAIAAGIRLNRRLGSLGVSQKFLPTVDADLKSNTSLKELVAKLRDGTVDSLLILGDNPVFTAPGDVDLAAAIANVKHSIYHGEYDDETGELCDWSIPLSHPLESWGDCIDGAGYYGVCQPHILPLLSGIPVIELLSLMLDENPSDGLAIVRRTAEEIAADQGLSHRQWRKLLHDGYLESLTLQSKAVQASAEKTEFAMIASLDESDIDHDKIEVIFTAADGIYDGRFANIAWLQELPQAMTKITWDNAAVMSPATARAIGTEHGRMVALRVNDASIEMPVYEMPGCAPGVVTTSIGYGRTRAGKVGGYLREDDVDIVGVDVSPIRRLDAMLIAYDIEARPRFDQYELATTQNHWAIDTLGQMEAESRSYTLIREGTLALYDVAPDFVEAMGPHVPEVGESGSLWQEPINTIEETFPELPQWGMAIDLSKCTGCNACVIACQSENNVPIVGRDQVLMSREMHWLRLDRYFQGDEENVDVVHQPMACQHCETAPCEQVCPVAATVHSPTGINLMVCNRCIGTRYCANNCPFKVRRFNYFNYNKAIGVGYGWDAYPEDIEEANRRLQQLVLNPEVTVRGRGVMEKCTYCIQRIENAKITAREQDRPIADGDIVTACQSACPTLAIEFGNVGDLHSAVSKQQAQPRSYKMLQQLNLKTRTEYLARITNPHPRLMTTRQLLELAASATDGH